MDVTLLPHGHDLVAAHVGGSHVWEEHFSHDHLPTLLPDLLFASLEIIMSFDSHCDGDERYERYNEEREVGKASHVFLLLLLLLELDEEGCVLLLILFT